MDVFQDFGAEEYAGLPVAAFTTETVPDGTAAEGLPPAGEAAWHVSTSYGREPFGDVFARFLRTLGSLSLAMGTLTDQGAEALLSGQPLTHLRRLDLHHHFLSDAMMKRVKATLPGVEVDLDDQQEAKDDWYYVAVSE